MTSISVLTISIAASAVEGIKEHAKREADKGGYEAVGFLAKSPKRDEIHTLAPMSNHAANPQEAFFVEPWQQYQTERKLAEDNYQILGVYHSHVNSEALPSQSDHRMARPDEYVFIYSVVFDELKAYKENGGSLEPVELVVRRPDGTDANIQSPSPSQ